MTLEGTVGATKFKFKVVFLGDQSVGKTSIIHRFIYDSFDDNYQATIGIDFMSHKMFVEEKIIILNLWDTAGQEKFKTITAAYYKGAQGLFLVFDITDRKSFKDIENWIMEVDKYANPNIIKILIGNKSDL